MCGGSSACELPRQDPVVQGAFGGAYWEKGFLSIIFIASMHQRDTDLATTLVLTWGQRGL